VTTEWLDLPEEPASTQRLDFEGAPAVETQRLDLVDEEQLLTERVRTPLLGIVAIGLAVLAGVFQGVGIAGAGGGDYAMATVLAWAAVGASAIAFVLGAIAAVMHLGRRTGIAAMLLALVANPWLLMQTLGLLGGGAA